MKRFLLSCLVIIASIEHGKGQDVDWEKNVQGKLITPDNSETKGIKIHEIFKAINQLELISKPAGFNIHEYFTKPELDKIYKGKLHIEIFRYYSREQGQVQIQKQSPYTVIISYNNLYDLMNEQTVFLEEESRLLGLPIMFTDSFPIVYSDINGFMVGQALDTEWEMLRPLYILRPENKPLFRQLSKQEYYRFFIGKLNIDIKKESLTLEEFQTIISENSKNASTSSILPELRKQQAALKNWVAFLKSKQQNAGQKLVSMSDEEKNSPAYYASYRTTATMVDRNGRYVEAISGHIEYEPLESSDTIYTRPVFTFIEQPFNAKLPKTAIQLIVIFHPFSLDKKSGIKDVLDKQFFPLLPYNELGGMMYK